MADPHGGLHQGRPIFGAGEAVEDGQAAVIMLHGRGATAGDILKMHTEFNQSGVAYVAPQAAGNTWYPNSFMAPIDSNEPALSSALQLVGDIVAHIEDAGIPTERIMLLGFSQGGCLALEYVARNAQRYGGVVGLSAGVIGPEGTPRDYEGTMDGTPVFLGCSDIDPHIPKERVEETAQVFKDLDADVTMRLYRGMAHTVNADERDVVRSMLSTLTGGE